MYLLPARGGRFKGCVRRIIIRKVEMMKGKDPKSGNGKGH